MVLYAQGFYGQDPYGASIEVDFQVDPFIAVPFGYNSVRVTWSTPTGSWTRLRLLQSRVGFAANENDGTVLLDQTTAASEFFDTGLLGNSWYYYSLYIEHDGTWSLVGTSSALSVGYNAMSEIMWERLPRWFRYQPNPQDGSAVRVWEPTAEILDPNGLWQENTTLKNFLGILGWGLDYLHNYTNTLLWANDTKNAHLTDVYRLSQTLGEEWEPRIPAYLMRQKVQNAGLLAKSRGTMDGLRDLVATSVGYDVELTIGPNLFLNEDQSAFESPQYPEWDSNAQYGIGAIVKYGMNLFRFTNDTVPVLIDDCSSLTGWSALGNVSNLKGPITYVPPPFSAGGRATGVSANGQLAFGTRTLTLRRTAATTTTNPYLYIDVSANTGALPSTTSISLSVAFDGTTSPVLLTLTGAGETGSDRVYVSAPASFTTLDVTATFTTPGLASAVLNVFNVSEAPSLGTVSTAPVGNIPSPDFGNTANPGWQIVTSTASEVLRDPESNALVTWSAWRGSRFTRLFERLGESAPVDSSQYTSNSLWLTNNDGATSDYEVVGVTDVNSSGSVNSLHPGIVSTQAVPIPRATVWDSTEHYETGAYVTFGGACYHASRDSQGRSPEEFERDWTRISFNDRLPIKYSFWTHGGFTDGTNAAISVSADVEFYDGSGKPAGRAQMADPTSPLAIPMLDTFNTGIGSPLPDRTFDLTPSDSTAWTSLSGQWRAVREDELSPGMAWSFGEAGMVTVAAPSASIPEYVVAATFGVPLQGREQYLVVSASSDGTSYVAIGRSNIIQNASGTVTTLYTFDDDVQDDQRVSVVMTGSELTVLVDGDVVSGGFVPFTIPVTTNSGMLVL